MNRRALIAGALAALATPLAVEPQPSGKVYRIGYLSPRSGIERNEEAFRQALGQLGYVEGQNLVIEWRFTRGRPVASELAAELVHLKLDFILGLGVGPVAALKKSTATIPSRKALSLASRAQAETSRVSPALLMTWRANGWSS